MAVSSERLDAVMMIPFQPYTGHAIEPLFRQTMGSYMVPHVLRGYAEFASFCGRELLFRDDNRPAFGPERLPVEFTAHRSLTALALATHLDRAGLRWKVLDPGQQEIRFWRHQLEALRPLRPRCVGVSTTFTVGGRWLRALLAVVREALPGTKILLGGYYYTSDAADFLSMDADVFVIGEGERRLEQIVAAIRDEKPLDKIAGIYLRRENGPLHHTGKAEPAPLDELPPIDWTLAARVDPPLDLSRDFLDMALETQRGCVFKCEFCTYRTLARPNFMSVEVAVERILATGVAPRAVLRLTDSTATFPHERWRDLMRKLGDAGGSPHPLWVYARVSDIDEPTAALMARAGVREVFIGQESGDQEILNAMKKGTHVKQIVPALHALHRHGIWSFFSFIHGFPGEHASTISNTRALIASLNDGFPADDPAVAWYNVNPFYTQDFAAVASKTDAMRKGMRYLGFDPDGETSTKRMAEECLTTMLAAARVPTAPAFVHVLTFLNSPAHGAVEPEPSLIAHPHRREFQRWMKSVERGIAIFIEREVDGTRPDLAELRRLRENVLASYPTAAPALRRVATGFAHRVIAPAARRVRREWAAEARRGIGLGTRLGLSLMAWSDSGRAGAALRCLRTGEYHPQPPASEHPVETREAAWDLATDAIVAAGENSRRLTEIVRKANLGLAAREKTIP